MKTCSKCKRLKPFEAFYLVKGKPGYWCKACRVSAACAYQAQNRAAHNASTRAHKARNRERIRAENRAYKLTNRDLVREQKRKYMRGRKALMAKATPPWADLAAIAAFYKACPPGHCVDHVVPLNHPDVTGLHTIENLQYLTAAESLAKGNLFDGSLANDSWRTR